MTMTTPGGAAEGADNQSELEVLRAFRADTIAMITRALDAETPEGQARMARMLEDSGTKIAWTTGDMAQVFDYVLDQRAYWREQATMWQQEVE